MTSYAQAQIQVNPGLIKAVHDAQLPGYGLDQFEPWPKIKRLSVGCVITEKLDGTNAQVCIDEYGTVRAGSRTRWITPENDNYGFAAWVKQNEQELLKLGQGRHFGEWWGCAIQRGYGLSERRFSLFNTSRWANEDAVKYALPSCCSVVPVLYKGEFTSDAAWGCLNELEQNGSRAAPGFMKPEGIVVWHSASNTMFKKTLDGDGHKGNPRITNNRYPEGTL